MKTGIFLLMIFLSSYLWAQDNKQERYIDSLEIQLTRKQNDTTRIMLLQDIAFAYSNLNPDEAIKYAQKAIVESGHVKDMKWQASSNGMLALSYNAKADYHQAVLYNEKALAIYSKLGHHKSSAAIYSNLSVIHLGQGNYAAALKTSFVALRICEESKAGKNTAIVLENIGHIYYEQKDYGKTEDYYNRALKIYRASGTPDDVARAIGNLARVYQARNEYPKALEYLFDALRTNKKSGLLNSVQTNLANIGNVYTKLGDYDKAIEYHSKALQISQQLGIRSSIAVNYGNLGSTYLEMSKRHDGSNTEAEQKNYLSLALTDMEKAVHICREIGFSVPLSEFNQGLIEAYELSGNYKKAFEVQRDNTALRDSIFSLQSKVELSNLETKRDLELKNKDIIIKEELLKIKRLKMANQKMMYLSGIFGLCILIFILVRYFMKRARSHRHEMENLIHIHSHTIRGPVASILGLAELLNYNDPNDPANKEMLEGIHTIAVDLDKVIVDTIQNTKGIDEN